MCLLSSPQRILILGLLYDDFPPYPYSVPASTLEWLRLWSKPAKGVGSWE
jgi:hypothetical protein